MIEPAYAADGSRTWLGLLLCLISAGLVVACLWLALLRPAPAADWSDMPAYTGWVEHRYTTWGP